MSGIKVSIAALGSDDDLSPDLKFQGSFEPKVEESLEPPAIANDASKSVAT